VYVGITGGIGSGKTTVADLFGELFSADGAVVIHADELAHRALAASSRLLPVIAERFGADLIDALGNVDRRALGDIVFADESKRQALEELVHPEVARLARVAKESAPVDSIVFYDVPLLAEKSMANQFDAVIVVECPIETRRIRLIERGLTLPEIDARIAVQASDDERRAVADFVITNGTSLSDLVKQVESVWAALTA